MSNMSYCRFENTSHDLADCIEAMDSEESVSPAEHKARIRLVRACAKIVFDFAGAESVEEAVEWAESLSHD